jgi:hypothetical protein
MGLVLLSVDDAIFLPPAFYLAPLLDRFKFCLTSGWSGPMFESIQVEGINRRLDRFRKERAMHPVNYLFEDIYRNDWSITSNAVTRIRRGSAGPWIRDLRFFVERKRS